MLKHTEAATHMVNLPGVCSAVHNSGPAHLMLGAPGHAL